MLDPTIQKVLSDKSPEFHLTHFNMPPWLKRQTQIIGQYTSTGALLPGKASIFHWIKSIT